MLFCWCGDGQTCESEGNDCLPAATLATTLTTTVSTLGLTTLTTAPVVAAAATSVAFLTTVPAAA